MTQYLPGRRLRTGREATAAAAIALAIAVGLVWTLVASPWRVLAIVAIGLVPVAYRTLRTATIARFNHDTRGPLELMATNPELAARQLEEVAEQFPWPAHLSRLTGYNRGLAQLRAGRLDAAVDTLAHVDRTGGVVALDAPIAGTLAYIHALRGDLPTATAWLTEAKRRCKTAPERYPHVLAEIAIELRAGKAREAGSWLVEHWPRLEHAMTAERLRPLRALRGFALAQAGVAGDPAAPLRYGELAYLAVAWPELDQFLRGNLAA